MTYIPWWLMWIFLWTFLGFFYLRWWFDQPRSRSDLPIVLGFTVLGGVFQVFFLLVFLTEAVLPVNLSDPTRPRVVISYHFVFIPLELSMLILGFWAAVMFVKNCIGYAQSNDK